MSIGNERRRELSTSGALQLGCSFAPDTSRFISSARQWRLQIESTEWKVYFVESSDDFVDQFHYVSPQRVINSVMFVTQIDYSCALSRSIIFVTFITKILNRGFNFIPPASKQIHRLVGNTNHAARPSLNEWGICLILPWSGWPHVVSLRHLILWFYYIKCHSCYPVVLRRQNRRGVK